MPIIGVLRQSYDPTLKYDIMKLNSSISKRQINKLDHQTILKLDLQSLLMIFYRDFCAEEFHHFDNISLFT